jgi:hypothetical protein
MQLADVRLKPLVETEIAQFHKVMSPRTAGISGAGAILRPPGYVVLSGLRALLYNNIFKDWEVSYY